MMSNILASVITAIVTAILATVIFVLVQVAVFKKLQKNTASEQVKNDASFGGEGPVYEEVDIGSHRLPAPKNGSSGKGEMLEIMTNKAYGGVFFGNK